MSFGNFLGGFVGSGGIEGLGKVAGNMKDDKGMFQGGSQGDMFGRIKDLFGGQKRKEEGARDFMKDFDPTNKQSVTDMQKRLNSAGGNLKVDGIMGPKTLQAVRAMQAGGGAADVFSPAHPPPNSASMTGIAPSPMQQQQMMGQGPVLQMPQAPNPVSPAMGPVQQQDRQDPYGFGVDASGQTYGGGVGPWAPR
tara:strand:- start:1058 stop:1639 length:582 start_codon:yes stop_codon:yes gene_type:complete